MCSSEATLWALKALRVTQMLVWEFREALCTLSKWNKATLLWVTAHCGIRGSEGTDGLARMGSSSLFLILKPATSVSPCVRKLKVK
jgi:hypothetical protein